MRGPNASKVGYIPRLIRVQLDAPKVGLPVSAFVASGNGSSDYVGDEAAHARMKNIRGVLECHHIAGDDLLHPQVARPISEACKATPRDHLRGPNSQNEHAVRRSCCRRCSRSRGSFPRAR